jgi:hypothetical protein
MPFFDRGGKDKQPDPLERLRQFTSQPVPPPPPPASASPPPGEAAAVPPNVPPVNRLAELDALLEEAVGQGAADDTLTGNEPLPPLARAVPAPAREDDSVEGFIAAAAAPAAAPAGAQSALPASEPTGAAPPTSPPVTSGPGVNFGTPPPPAAPARRFVPQRPTDVDSTGLSRVFLSDQILRTVYFAGEITGAGVAEAVGLPFVGVLDGLIEQLRRENVLDVKGQRGLGEAGFVLGLTDRGGIRAHEALQKVQYRGCAPVPLDDYVNSVRAQTNRNVTVTQANIRAAFGDLLISDSVLDEVGPAVNSGSSMFLFGYPGNGKTSIAERITRLMGDSIYIPYAIEVDGQIIKLFDSVLHEPVEQADSAPRPNIDRRWIEIKRPTVVVGGELTMASLDLLFNDVGGFYEAPLQMKANGGMFLIDDFGRQLIRPTDLLNRWIVPLEKRVDFLTLITGKKITIPFEELIVFSTNLDPRDLVDDAFLRRIKFKINVQDPDLDQFRQIFKLVARSRGIEYDEDTFNYLLARHYQPSGRPLRMCQPRDLLDQLVAIARYKMLKPEMTPALIDAAASTYFVTMGPANGAS